MAGTRDPGQLARELAARRAASVRQWRPERVGDSGMRIAADGTWYYLGSPIRRLPMVQLFASVLRRDPDGWYLVTPVEKLRIAVEDAPFIAVDFDVRSGRGRDQRIEFRTNVDDLVVAGPEHPLRMRRPGDDSEPRAYVVVRDGLDALVSRAAWYRLAELAEVAGPGDRELVGVWSEGVFFPLQDTEPD